MSGGAGRNSRNLEAKRMPRHRNLNLQKFIESIPEPLLKEYFQKKVENDQPLPLQKFDYKTISQFLEAAENEEFRDTVLEEFTCINDICEKVMNILVQAIQKYKIDTTGDENKYELAMDIFLHHEKAYNYAYDYYCLFNASSKMSDHNLTAENFEINQAKISQFKAQISAFYNNSAKGQECIVRTYEEDGEIVIVVIRGSYKRSVTVWNKAKVRTIFFRPATEDILQYNPNTSKLYIKAPYQKDKDNYINAFAETVLGDKSQADRADRDNTYTLEPVQNGTFSYQGNEKIKAVTLLEVKLVMRGETKPTVEIKSSNIVKTLEKDIPGLALSSGEIVQAKFRFELNIDGKSKNINIEVTPPSVTDLHKKKYADIIGAYLEEQGVKLV